MPRKKSKPVAEHIEANKPTEPTTEPQAVAVADQPVSEMPPEQPAPAKLEQPTSESPAVPTADARIETALQSAPVMRASRLESPPEEQDGAHGPNRWAGVVRDSRQKLRIDKETVRKPGQPYLRVLISFPKDAKPSDEERKLLKGENFTFDGDSWGKELSGPNVLLAKQVVNEIYKMRGDDYQIFLG